MAKKYSYVKLYNQKTAGGLTVLNVTFNNSTVVRMDADNIPAEVRKYMRNKVLKEATKKEYDDYMAIQKKAEIDGAAVRAARAANRKTSIQLKYGQSEEQKEEKKNKRQKAKNDGGKTKKTTTTKKDDGKTDDEKTDDAAK